MLFDFDSYRLAASPGDAGPGETEPAENDPGDDWRVNRSSSKDQYDGV